MSLECVFVYRFVDVFCLYISHSLRVYVCVCVDDADD